MNVLARLIVRGLYAITAHLPCRLIPLPNGPYLERYYLGFWRGQHRYLHRFIRNDSERHLHDHPWPVASAWVITGWYIEERGSFNGHSLLVGLNKVRWFNRLHRRQRAYDLHRIVSIRRETWTLFSHPKWSLPWGFYELTDDPQGWRYRQYKPAPRTQAEKAWWLTAPPGKHAGREPLTL